MGFGFIGEIFEGISSGFVTPVFSWLSKREDDGLAGFQEGAKQDTATYVAYLNAYVQVSQTKAAQSMWWGARLVWLVAAGACTVHMAAVMLDSMPLLWHAVGSWGVVRPPAPYDDYEAKIVLSNFIITPLAPVASAATAWLHKR